MIAVATIFWLCVALLAYTHLGYPLVLWILIAGICSTARRLPKEAAAIGARSRVAGAGAHLRPVPGDELAAPFP